MVAGDAPPRHVAAARADATRALWRPKGPRGAEATAEVPWRPAEKHIGNIAGSRLTYPSDKY